MADRIAGDTDADRRIASAIAAMFLVLSAPLNAYAVQVGCFVTAILLSFMFFLSLLITLTLKSLLSRRVGGVPKTPWKRMLVLTGLELFLFVLVFTVTRTIPVTLLIYLPLAAALNSLVLTKSLVLQGGAVPVPKRILLFTLLSLSLPAAIRIAGVVWSAFTTVISSTEFHT